MEEIYEWRNLMAKEKHLEMTHHVCFPTDIYEIPDVLNRDDMKSMLVLINSWWEDRGYDDNWQTNPDLHTLPEFEKLTKFILNLNKDLIKRKGYDVEDIKISDMWANVLRPGETHPIHTHSNNLLSGVYYLYSNQKSGIVFMDPVLSRDVITPKKIRHDSSNSAMLVFKSRPNTAIIFPSWLHHYVPPHTGETNRISISWNIQPIGQVGHHHQFQSAEFK